MLTLTSIIAGLTWLASNLWVLFIALVPSVLSFLSPLLQGLVDLLRKMGSALWTGASENKWEQWILFATGAAIAGAVGYHFGWQACIDWVHTHFKLVSRIPLSSWWKLW